MKREDYVEVGKARREMDWLDGQCANCQPQAHLIGPTVCQTPQRPVAEQMEGLGAAARTLPHVARISQLRTTATSGPDSRPRGTRAWDMRRP